MPNAKIIIKEKQRHAEGSRPAELYGPREKKRKQEGSGDPTDRDRTPDEVLGFVPQ